MSSKCGTLHKTYNLVKCPICSPRIDRWWLARHGCPKFYWGSSWKCPFTHVASHEGYIERSLRSVFSIRDFYISLIMTSNRVYSVWCCIASIHWPYGYLSPLKLWSEKMISSTGGVVLDRGTSLWTGQWSISTSTWWTPLTCIVSFSFFYPCDRDELKKKKPKIGKPSNSNVLCFVWESINHACP